MKSDIDRLDQFYALLHNQSYHLDQANDEKITISRIVKINVFVTVLLIVLGIAIMIIGVVSLTMEKPEILGGLFFFLVGILLILFPIYNFYSKKNFRVSINKSLKVVEFSPATFFLKKNKYSFAEISKLILKHKKINTFVDNSSSSSYANYFSLSLDLSDGKNPALLHLSCQTEEVDCLINEFTDMIAAFMEIEKVVIENKV